MGLRGKPLSSCSPSGSQGVVLPLMAAGQAEREAQPLRRRQLRVPGAGPAGDDKCPFSEEQAPVLSKGKTQPALAFSISPSTKQAPGYLLHRDVRVRLRAHRRSGGDGGAAPAAPPNAPESAGSCHLFPPSR